MRVQWKGEEFTLTSQYWIDLMTEVLADPETTPAIFEEVVFDALRREGQIVRNDWDEWVSLDELEEDRQEQEEWDAHYRGLSNPRNYI